MPIKFPTTIELSSLEDKNGFVLTGTEENDRLGYSLNYVGDINADGKDDVFLTLAGNGYILFGSTEKVNYDVTQLDGRNGFSVDGCIGPTVSGDINADGIDDLIYANPFGSGKCVIIFGRSDIGNTGSIEVSALDGHNGFVVLSPTTDHQLGSSVSVAGDVNADGINDLIIAAPGANSGRGHTYIIFGEAGAKSSGVFHLNSLDGSNGFTIIGAI